MSDSDAMCSAWRKPPSRYLEERPPRFRLPERPRSLYLTMRDGCRLAADIYLPLGETPVGGFPTILILTPYYRRFALREGASPTTDPSPNAGKYRDFLFREGTHSSLSMYGVRVRASAHGTPSGHRLNGRITARLRIGSSPSRGRKGSLVQRVFLTSVLRLASLRALGIKRLRQSPRFSRCGTRTPTISILAESC